MSAPHSTTALQRRGSPLLSELEGVYSALDDDALILRLRDYRWTGRPGHSVRALWRAYLAAFVLNLPSTNALIRRLEEDESLRALCGFEALPSRWTFGRFVVRLSQHLDLVERVFLSATREVAGLIGAGFGRFVAIDSSVIKTYSNPNRRGVSDPEASWTIKDTTGLGKRAWFFGYKLHLAVDADTELPVSAFVTTAKESDTRSLLPLLDRAADTLAIRPAYVLADAGYDSHENIEGIAARGAEPIVKTRKMPQHGKRKENTLRDQVVARQNNAGWIEIYRKRQAVERVFSRLKEHRSLGKHTRRRQARVTLLCLSALIVTQASALMKLHRGDLLGLRACTRTVA